MSKLLDRENFVAEKLAWQRTLLADANLTLFAKVLGSMLMHHLHPAKGGAWPSQHSLAELLSVDPRTIRRAANELANAGHLKITVSRGRGRANFYEAMVRCETIVANSEDGKADTSAPQPLQSPLPPPLAPPLPPS